MKQIALGKLAVLTHGKMEEALAELPDQSVHLIFTDPPYGHNNNDGDFIAKHEEALGRKKAGGDRPIMNDDYDSASRLFKELLRQAERVLVHGGTLCVCCGGGGGPSDIQMARWPLLMQRSKQLSFKQIVIWDKGPMGLGWQYRRSYECVLVAHRVGAKALWFDTSKRVENIIRPGAYGISKLIPAKGQHPTEKPVELAELFIKLHTEPGHVVVDPFTGSGSTGVAAVRNGRRFIGVELDKVWFRAARSRIKRCTMAGGVDSGTDPPAIAKKLKPLWKGETA